MPKSDEQLMIETAGGDIDSFEEIVRRHQFGAFNVALRMLTDEHRAADAAQEAFLRVFENADTYKPTAKFSTYFYSILRRICIDHYRRKKPSLKPGFESNESDSKPVWSDLIKEERDRKIHEALSTLPARQRMAITLKYLRQMSYKEIGETMNCSTGAVDSLLIRARNKLKEILVDL